MPTQDTDREELEELDKLMHELEQVHLRSIRRTDHTHIDVGVHFCPECRKNIIDTWQQLITSQRKAAEIGGRIKAAQYIYDRSLDASTDDFHARDVCQDYIKELQAQKEAMNG